MPFTTSTELGRRVIIDDWRGFHRDRLLAMLYRLRDGGGDGNGLVLDRVGDVTGLDEARVRDLARLMRDGKPKLIEVSWLTSGWDARVAISGPVGSPFLATADLKAMVATISARGVRWVEESPRSPARDAYGAT